MSRSASAAKTEARPAMAEGSPAAAKRGYGTDSYDAAPLVLSRRDHEAGVQAMREAWRLSTPGLVAVALFSAIINILKLAIPLFVFQLLDRVLSSGSTDTLVILVVMTLIAVLCGIALDLVRKGLLTGWGLWIERRFGKQLFLAGLQPEGTQPKRRPSKLLRDLASLRSFVSGGGVAAWLDVVWAPFFLLIAYLIHPAIAALALACIAALLVLGYLNELMTRNSRALATAATTDRNDWVAAAEHNRETVGTLNLGESLAERWQDSLLRRHSEGLRTRRNTQIILAIMQFLGKFLHVASYGLGVWLVLEGSLTVGGIIAASVLSRMSYNTVRRAMARWRGLISARAAYERIRKALSEAPRPHTLHLAGDTQAPLVIEQLAFRYPGGMNSVFRRVTLQLDPGEILCVIGPCGSGKSTFAQVVAGFLPAKTGAVRLGDVDISRYPGARKRGHIGYLPQDVRLLRGTVSENIAGLGPVVADAVVEAAKLAGIHDTILHLKQGYDTVLEEQDTGLSGGETKALALARAFYRWPKLIVLDEPEANLDRTARRRLTQALRTGKAKGSIIIVTTQSTALARVADKVLLLGEGSRAQLLESETEIAALRQADRGQTSRRKHTAASA